MNGTLSREFTGLASSLSCKLSRCRPVDLTFDFSNRELRLELNLQKNVLDLSYPTFFPSPPDGLKTKDEAAWYFYLAEIALRRLENRILGYLYRPDTAISESTMVYAILDFEEQKDAW